MAVMKLFNSFHLDPVNECMWRNGRRLALTRKAFAIARHLVENAGRLVTKEELLETVWPGVYVQEANLKVYIRELRRVLGDEAGRPTFIETQTGRGYRFIAPVIESAPPSVRGSHTFRHVVGRTTELSKLQRCFEGAVRSERQVVFVTGEPGIGKTALVDQFVQWVASVSQARVTGGQCIEGYREQEPFYPLLEALGRLCRGPDGERVVGVLARNAPTWLLQFPALVTREWRDRLQVVIVPAARERMLREACEALEALTAEAPLLLALEDVHWSDLSTLDLISALARRREPVRFMLVATYRPVDVVLLRHPLKRVRQELQVHGLCKELPLEALKEGAVAEYLTARFSVSGVARRLAHTLHAQTDGNPLFMVTAVDCLVARGLIERSGGDLELRGSSDQISRVIPESLHQFLETQIEQLTVEEQTVLMVASVVGFNFTAWSVAAASGRDPAAVEDCCEELARRELMLRGAGLSELPNGAVSPCYQFTHSLYRRVLYRKCGAVLRLRMHRRLGERLEEVWAERSAEIAPELARHFQEGHDAGRAAYYQRIAAARRIGSSI